MSSYGPLADWYDSLTEDVDYEGLYAYLMAIFRRNGIQPDTVLDMACGTGSLSILFAENGSRCYGMDRSQRGYADPRRHEGAGYEPCAHVPPW